MENIAFVHIDLLLGSPPTTYQPAGVNDQVSDVLASLARMHYEVFFLADVESYVQSLVRDWLLLHKLIRQPVLGQYEDNEPGTLERVLFRPLYTIPEHRALWMVLAMYVRYNQ